MHKKVIIPILLFAAMYGVVACGGNNNAGNTNTSSTEQPAAGGGSASSSSSYDPKRGEGKYDETNVTVGALDVAMAEKGKTAANTKCISCHKLTDEKLVGPGWKGVTERRTPHWIMNFITNPDPMIDKDPAVQAQLELCLVRMPNQNLEETEARSIVEYMRQNDGVK